MLLFAGNNELMEYLLSKGAEVDSQSDAGTPLIWAAGHGQQDALKVLLEHHANVISPLSHCINVIHYQLNVSLIVKQTRERQKE